MTIVFTIIGSIFVVTCTALFKLDHTNLGLLFAALAIISYMTALYVFFHPKKKIKKNKKLENIFGEIAKLYNQTAIYIQESFNITTALDVNKGQSLHQAFENFIKYENSNKLSLPQELEVAIMSFFDLLHGYKRDADLIVNASKTNECYQRWLGLKQNFDSQVARSYSQLEVRFRKLLNK